jgi:hypothetical protein
MEDLPNYAVEVSPYGLFQTLEDDLWFLLFVRPSSQPEGLPPNPLDPFFDSFFIRNPSLHSFKHPKDGIFSSNANQNLQEFIILQKIEPLKLDSLFFQEMRNCFGDGLELFDMIIEQYFSILIEIFSRFYKPFDIFHAFLKNRQKLFRLSRQLFLRIFARKNRKQTQKFLLMDNCQGKQFSQTIDISQMKIAFLSGKCSIFVINDIQQSSCVLLNLLTKLVVVVENYYQRVLVKIIAFEADRSPPVLKLLQKMLDLLLLMRF